MNIALVVPGFSAREDDWCIPSLLDFVRMLATTETVTVFTLRYPHSTRPYTVFGARVVPLGGRQVAGLRRYPLLARAVSAIVGAHDRERFDLIHAVWADEPGWVGTTAATNLHVPLIVSVRGGEVERWRDQKYGAQRSWFGRAAVKRSLRHADRWTVGSKYMMRRVLERVPQVQATRGVLAPEGVDLEQFSPDDTRLKLGPTSEGLGPTHLLSVASLTPIKRHDLLIHAFRQVHDRRPDARLHLVGDGPLRKNLEQERDASGLREA
ncbi:MAG: glycosyltransferase, partial [Acidobacteria bacterium]|nr:glycosyltransferase [Acidobacteriota bacterium]